MSADSNGIAKRCERTLNNQLFQIFTQVVRWRSYDRINYLHLQYTINQSIMKLLDRIENQHGKILVSHALGYLTAAKSGLSEAELEDLLSLDEKVKIRASFNGAQTLASLVIKYLGGRSSAPTGRKGKV